MTSDRERVRESIEAGIQRFGASVDEQLRTLMDELWTAAEQERETAIDEVRATAAAELAEACAAAEARAREEAEQTLAAAPIPMSVAADPDPELAAELERVRNELSAAEAELARARDQLMNARADGDGGQGEESPAAVDSARLARSIRRLDDARSLTEVLDTLADALRDEAARTVILLMKGAQAQAWQPSGFPAGYDRSVHAIDGATGGVVGHAIATADMSFDRSDRGDEPIATGLEFAEVPSGHAALAVPLIVGGRIAAVVYADDVGGFEMHGHSWAAVIEVLVRHAGLCLEVLTARRAAVPATVGGTR